MSNQMKEISIRPIESIVPRQLEPEQTEEIKLQSMKQQILDEKKQLQTIREKQEALIQQTRTHIETEKAQWEEEKQKIIEESKKIGYQDGFVQGQKEGYEQYDEKLTEANRIVDATMKDYHNELETSAESILELSIQVAERIIQEKLDEQPELFLNLVKAAVHDIKDQPKVSIILHPSHYDLVSSHQIELQRMLGRDSKLAIYVNDELDEKDCYIEHPFGQIEASVDTQLIMIRDALMEYLMETKA